MKILKHVGKHSGKPIVLIYRQIPGDDHMCLVVYSDSLGQMVHDEVMTCLESAIGQNSEDLADALFRVTMKDGTNCLEYLHKNGILKKVNTNQVVITPNAKSSVRLDELNVILNEMKQGEDAIKRLADLDSNAGLSGKTRAPREVGVSPASRSQEAEVSTAVIGDVLTDEQLASQRIAQAANMKLQAEQLLAEAKRLEAEASELTPAVPVAKTPVAKKNVTPKPKKTTTKAKTA
jgi:hypothetical protein